MLLAIVAKRNASLELYQGLLDFITASGHEVLIIDPNEVYLDINQNELYHCTDRSPLACDLLLNRSVASDAYYVKDIIRALKSNGTLIYNDLENAVDFSNKILTHEYLTRRGVPNLSTKVTLFKNLGTTLNSFHDFSAEFVVKENFGHGGAGVYKTNILNYASLPFLPEDYVIVQKYAGQEYDYRVLVLDGEVLGIMKRTPPSGEFRSNMGLGSRSELISDSSIAQLAILASEGLAFSGVDILKEEEELKVIEVNSKPSYRYFESEHKLEIAKQLGNSLINFFNKHSTK